MLSLPLQLLPVERFEAMKHLLIIGRADQLYSLPICFHHLRWPSAIPWLCLQSVQPTFSEANVHSNSLARGCGRVKHSLTLSVNM